MRRHRRSMLTVYRPDPTNMPTQKKIVDMTVAKRIVSIFLPALSHYDSTVRCHDCFRYQHRRADCTLSPQMRFLYWPALRKFFGRSWAASCGACGSDGLGPSWPVSVGSHRRDVAHNRSCGRF
jgi:hypothetical protein